MMKDMNGWEMSRSSSVKIRSHSGATTEDLNDYVRPTVQKKQKTKMMVIMTLKIKSTPCRKLEW